MNDIRYPASKDSHLIPLGAFLAGVLLAFIDSAQTLSPADNLLLLLLRPLTLLGEGLRAWSLSGAAGNAAAWTAVIVLSLLPCAYVLIAHRKQPRRSDFLFPILSGLVFLCLYLLVNPSLVMHPLLASSASAQLQRTAPALVLCCALIACLLIQWADSLREDKPLSSLLKSMKLLLLLIMLLLSASAGYTLCTEIQSLLSSSAEYLGYMAAYAVSVPNTADAWVQMLLSLFPLTAQCFLIFTLHRARLLCGAFAQYGFHSRTEQCASDLAAQARYTLIALCACMALKSTCAMLLGRYLSDLSISLNIPLGEMAFACGTLLLARCISAACRIKRENDLII